MMDEVKKATGGRQRINFKDFREQMIKNGFKRPKFFVRIDERSP
jgi:hypothetical protein